MKKTIILMLSALLFVSGKAPVKTVEQMPVSLEIKPPVVEIRAYPTRKIIGKFNPQLIELNVVEPEDTEEPTEEPEYTEEEIQSITALAKMAAGEYFLIDTPEHKMYCAAVVECAMWRVMKGEAYGFSSTPEGVVSQPWQFLGYNPDNVVSEELWFFVADVFNRTSKVLAGDDALLSGCVLPTDYLWFVGNGQINYFRNAYEGGQQWYWQWGNPYE